MRSPTPYARIDITGEVCPMTYVRVKVALEALPGNAVLEVRLVGEAVLQNLQKTIVEDGYEVLALNSSHDGISKLLLLRARSAG